MKQHLFRRVFVLYLVVLLVAVVFTELYVTGIIKKNHVNELIKSLSAEARLISDSVSPEPRLSPDELSRRLKELTGMRVTLIDASGNVLGDSDGNAGSMENHLNRPEIQQSILREYGSSIRRSRTMGSDLLYVAKKITRNGQAAGFVRLAMRLDTINRATNALRLKINSVVIFMLLLSAVFMVWQTERIRRIVRQITEYSGALALGLFKRKLFLDNAGEFTELVNNLNDMSAELERNIQKGVEETNRLNVILKNIPDALLHINSAGIIERANNIARDLFNQPELTGRPYIEVVRSSELLQLIDHVRKTRLPGSAELSLAFPEVKYLSVRVSPLYYKVGELSGFVAIFRDITRMKKLEQMRRDFVANVSHEMKTPVTAIRGFAETLIDGAMYDRENAEKFLKTIMSHSDRLNRLVEDLLTLSRIELGTIKINISELNFAEAVDDVTQSLVVQTAEKDLAVRASIPPDDVMMRADRERLEQILLNLLDNAIKFTDQGEIMIGISREDGKKYFYVRDTGIGIPDKYLPRIGERFFRVDPSRSRAQGGTGLGLAIVKHLVMAQGWEMKIESEAGKGTVVKIYYA